MKINLKLIAIGIIILYCLTPLGAVEINTCDTKIGEQTTGATGAANAHNETKVVNNTDNTDAQTDVRDDVDTKTGVKDDARDSNSTIATKEVGKTAKDSNDTLNSVFDVDMDAYAEDIYEGSPIKVHCTAYNHQYPEDTAIAGQISVTANGTSLVYGEMHDGIADLQLTNQLKPGNYILKIHYFSNGKYSPADATTTLTVKAKHDANLNIKVDDVSNSGDAIINVTTNKEINNEFISVKLNTSSTTYDVKITNGEGKINVHNLKAGKHTVTANYQGNEKFKSKNTSATFSVNKEYANLNIKVHDVTPSNAIIDLTTNKKINNESVAVKLNSSSTVYKVKITNGEGRLYVHNLKAGKHLVIATYASNGKIESDCASATFTVKPGLNPNLGIHVADITEGQHALAKVTADKNLSGNVDVKLDIGITYHLKLKNGEASVLLSNGMISGKHVATVYFEGNEVYEAGEASTKFTVNERLDPKLGIHVEDITEGENAIVEVTADKNLSGKVNVKLSTGNTYHVKLKNGKGSVSISDLRHNFYTATAYFEGNEVYKASTAATSFFVCQKHESSLAVSNFKLHPTTGKDTTTVNPKTSGQHPLLQA